VVRQGGDSGEKVVCQERGSWESVVRQWQGSGEAGVGVEIRHW
jgi:hypothetical protein